MGGKDISGLHIYLFAVSEDYKRVAAANGKLDMDVSAEKAVVSTEIKI